MPTGDSFEKAQAELEEIQGSPPDERDVLSYRLYPKVFKEYIADLRAYSDVAGLPTEVFLAWVQNRSFAGQLDRKGARV